MLPEEVHILDREGRELRCDDEKKRREKEEHGVGNDIMVSKLHILQFDGFLEIGELSRGCAEQWSF